MDDTLPSSTTSAASGSNAGASAPNSSSQPQVRSRITVVCAECKRLKLKCDRRTPCGSCVKRDTVVRCIYSPAAAEKVDLHSLNNRLIQVEALLAQFQQASDTIQSAHAVPTPAPTTTLSIPIHEIHACLQSLGVALNLPPSSSPSKFPSPPPPMHDFSPSALRDLLPEAQFIAPLLSQAHNLLSGAAAAPFALSWLERRTYVFLSADKDVRRREKERLRERARFILSGGPHANSSSLALVNASVPYGLPSHSHYGADSAFPPIHTLPPSPSASHPLDSDESADDIDELLSVDERALPHINTNNLDAADGVKLHVPEYTSMTAQQKHKGRRGDRRLAFFALLCAVLSLSPPSSVEQRSPSPNAETLAAFAQRAAEEYLSGSGSSGESAAAADQQEDPDTDALLAMYVLAVRSILLSEGGEEQMGGVYVHMANTVAQARLCGFDQPLPSLSSPSSSPYGAHAGHYSLLGMKKPKNLKKGIKEEEGEIFDPSSSSSLVNAHLNGGLMEENDRDRDREMRALRARTWWAVVWGDLLVADALGLPAHVSPSTTTAAAPASSFLPCSSSSPSPSSSSHSNNEKDKDGTGGEDLLDAQLDWVAPLSDDGQGRGHPQGGRAFGAAIRFARLVSQIRTQGGGGGGVEGACCRAEGVLRGWAAAEFASPFDGRGHMGMNGMDVDGGERERERGRAKAEAELMASRAALRGCVAWLGGASNSATGPGEETSGWAAAAPQLMQTQQQVVFAAVSAAHSLVRAGRSLWGGAPSAGPGSPSPSPPPFNSNNAHPNALYTSQMSSSLAGNSMYAPTATANANAGSLALRTAPPGRALFDAGVICAWAALRYPAEVFAAGAREGLGGALALLRAAADSNHALNDARSYSNIAALAGWSGRGEALRVLEGLARRAGIPGSGSGCNGVGALLPTPPLPGTLKRKHGSMSMGGGEAMGESKAEAAAARERERERNVLRDGIGKGLVKDNKEREKEKERKKRAGYPPVGIRVRPGKDGAPASPVSPLGQGMGRKSSVGSAKTGNGASPLAVVPPQPPQQQQRTQQQVEEMGYYPQQQGQQQQQPFRSRSPTQDPRIPLLSQQSMDYAVSPSSMSLVEAASSIDFSRRSFSDAPPPTQQQQQQQGYASDSTSAAMYELPRAGSYDADPTAAAYAAGTGSPYGSSASNGNAGGLSQASSPYTNTSAGLSTPTFGGGASSGGTSHHASPQVPAPGAYYAAGGGYEPQYEPQLAMDIPAPPLYDKHSQLYEVKPHMDHRYQLEQESRHGMPWQSPHDDQHQQQYQWPGDDFKFYAQ